MVTLLFLVVDVVDAIPRGTYTQPLNIPARIPHNNGNLRNTANAYASKKGRTNTAASSGSSSSGNSSGSGSGSSGIGYSHTDNDDSSSNFRPIGLDRQGNNIQIDTEYDYIQTLESLTLDGHVDIPAVGEQIVAKSTSGVSSSSRGVYITQMKARLMIEFDIGFSRIEFRLDVYDGVDIIEATLNCGIAGTNGPIISYLYGHDEVGVNVNDSTLSFGILTNDYIEEDSTGDCDVPINNIASLYEAIMQRKVYLNILTKETIPIGGEVRGQLRITTNTNTATTTTTRGDGGHKPFHRIGE